MYIYICKYTNTHIHTYIYTYIHMYMNHIYTYGIKKPWLKMNIIYIRKFRYTPMINCQIKC